MQSDPAMLGSAIATCISDIPFDGPCATTQVGLIDGEFVINPSLAQKEISDLQLTVASTREKVIMIEAGANEVPEDKMIEAIYKAHEVNQEIIRFIDKIVADCGKEKHLYASCAVPEELFAAIRQIVPPEEMEEAVFTDDKQTREENIREITARLQEKFADNEEWLNVLGEAVYQYQKKTVRKMILKDHKRPDGRKITEIRPLAAEVDLIREFTVLGNFTRQTQICMRQLWLLFPRLRDWTDWMNLKLPRDICTTITSRPTQSVRQNRQEDRGAVRSVMEHWLREHSFRYFRQQRSSLMRSVPYLRLLNQTALPLRQVSVHPPCL